MWYWKDSFVHLHEEVVYYKVLASKRESYHSARKEEGIELENTRDRPKGGSEGIEKPHVDMLVLMHGKSIQTR